MTRTEDLLRAALDGAVTPPTRIADPLTDLDRRLSRARRRLSIVAAVAVFVVTAAVVVPLTLIGRGDSSPAVARPGPHPVSTTWATAHVLAVAAGDGSMWSLEEHAGVRTRQVEVVQRDPVTGFVVKHWHVGTNNDFIAYAYDRVWVWGGGDGGVPRSTAMTLDPATGIASETAQLGRGNSFDSLVFAAGMAWAAVPQRNRLVSFGFQDRGTTVNVSPDRGVASVVRLGPNLVATIGRDGLVSPIQQQGIVNRNRRIAAENQVWVPAAGSTFWVSRRESGGVALYRQDLTTLRTAGSTVRLRGVPAAVAADPSGGLYVEAIEPRIGGLPALSYYSPGALSARSPNPTAILRFDDVEHLTVDPSGGVVYTNGNGALIHWNPAQPPLR